MIESLLNTIPLFLLVFCRLTAFFVIVPIFSNRNVPTTFKIGLSVFISIMIAVNLIDPPLVVINAAYIIDIFREILVGLSLGFSAYILFAALQLTGIFIDNQMGLAMANIVDPMSGTQIPIMGNFKLTFAILLFLSLDGHHYLLRAIMDSYQLVPLSNNIFSRVEDGSVSTLLLYAFLKMFTIAFQMAAPIVVVLFLTDVGLGILAKASPQFNLFVIGIPIKLLLGFVMLSIVVPGFLYIFQNLFKAMIDQIYDMLRLIGGA